MPDWVRDMLFIFMGIMVGCGALLAIAVVIGILREIIEERKKGKWK